ncbi:MAG: hypothetical protein WBA93_23430 [Microcoleaceae cyanobacterium]
MASKQVSLLEKAAFCADAISNLTTMSNMATKGNDWVNKNNSLIALLAMTVIDSRGSLIFSL